MQEDVYRLFANTVASYKGLEHPLVLASAAGTGTSPLLVPRDNLGTHNLYSHNLESTSINLVFFLLVMYSVLRFLLVGFLCLKTVHMFFGYFRRHGFPSETSTKLGHSLAHQHRDSSGLPSSQYGLFPFQPAHLSISTATKSFLLLQIHCENTIAYDLCWRWRGGAFWQLRAHGYFTCLLAPHAEETLN